jgi:hypothetical protein
MMHPEGTRLHPSVESEFFKGVQIGKCYRYNDHYYLFDDVKETAEAYGVHIKYCKPGTPEYKKFGCFAFKVIQSRTTKKIKKEKFTFDINNLVSN